jgi:integrase/recombinase XerD
MIERYCTIAPNIYGYSGGTISQYRYTLKAFDRWLSKPIERTTPSDVMDYLTHLKASGKAGATLTGTTAALRSFFDWLLLQRIVTGNPTAGIRQRGRTKRRLPTFLDRPELNALLAAPMSHWDPLRRDRDILFIAFLVSTGLRISEALSVKPMDLDWNNRSLTVIGKGNQQAVVFITKLVDPTLTKKLKDYIDTCSVPLDQPLFDISVSAVRRMLTRWGKKAGIAKHITPHTMRHTYANLLKNEAGLDIESLRAAMRHASINTTQIYIHTTPADLKNSLQAVNAI